MISTNVFFDFIDFQEGGEGPTPMLEVDEVDEVEETSTGETDDGETDDEETDDDDAMAEEALEEAEVYVLVREVFVVHVGGTRCVTFSTANNMKIRARITLTVEFIRTRIFLFLFDVSIQLRV